MEILVDSTWTKAILDQGWASPPFDQLALGGTFWSRQEARSTHRRAAGSTLLMNGVQGWAWMLHPLSLVRRQDTHSGFGEQFSRSGKMGGCWGWWSHEEAHLKGSRKNGGERDTQVHLPFGWFYLESTLFSCCLKQLRYPPGTVKSLSLEVPTSPVLGISHTHTEPNVKLFTLRQSFWLWSPRRNTLPVTFNILPSLLRLLSREGWACALWAAPHEKFDMVLEDEDVIVCVRDCLPIYLLIACLCLCCPPNHVYPRYVHVNILLWNIFPTCQIECKPEENETREQAHVPQTYLFIAPPGSEPMAEIGRD